MDRTLTVGLLVWLVAATVAPATPLTHLVAVAALAALVGWHCRTDPERTGPRRP